MVHALAVALPWSIVRRIGLTLASLLLAVAAVPARAQFTQLDDLVAAGGYGPLGGPVIKDGFLYDVIVYEGTSGVAVVNRVKTGGTAYTVLHHFTGVDGAYPYAGLLRQGKTL